MSYSPGDVVRLKSCIQRMTVEESEGERVTCVWIAGDSVGRASFLEVTLVAAPEDPLDEVRQWFAEEDGGRGRATPNGEVPRTSEDLSED